MDPITRESAPAPQAAVGRPQPPTPAPIRKDEAPRIGKEEKLRLEAQNRALLTEDFATGRLVFQSRPRVVELQLSNYCNMSCTMCYDGVNPPIKKLPEPLVERLAAELFPTASVFVPFATSEPLILTWDLTRRLAEQYGDEYAGAGVRASLVWCEQATPDRRNIPPQPPAENALLHCPRAIRPGRVRSPLTGARA